MVDRGVVLSWRDPRRVVDRGVVLSALFESREGLLETGPRRVVDRGVVQAHEPTLSL